MDFTISYNKFHLLLFLSFCKIYYFPTTLLIEVWHYAQNLGIMLVQENMKWVEAWWLKDDNIKKYLKLEKTNAIITLWFAVWF